jgi:hypothetical protein
MNRQLAAASIALCLGAGAVHAQTTTITTGAAPSATVVIEPEYRERIRSYVVENHVRPVETRARIVVGATLPEDIELRAVPPDWGPSIARYRYVYSNDQVMLVEPSTRRVIQVVE